MLSAPAFRKSTQLVLNASRLKKMKKSPYKHLKDVYSSVRKKNELKMKVMKHDEQRDGREITLSTINTSCRGEEKINAENECLLIAKHDIIGLLISRLGSHSSAKRERS